MVYDLSMGLVTKRGAARDYSCDILGGGVDAKDVTLTMSKSGDEWKIVEASPELIPSP